MAAGPGDFDLFFNELALQMADAISESGKYGTWSGKGQIMSVVCGHSLECYAGPAEDVISSLTL